MGDLPLLLKEALGAAPQVGFIRCVTDQGRKVTFASGAKATKQLIRSGAASDPNGVVISKDDFPVMLEGWPYRLRKP
jgi:hypothetical protein